MAGLVDTSVLVQLERQGALPSVLVRTLDPGLAVSSVTIAELLVGWRRAESDSRKTRRQSFIEATLAAMPVISFDLTKARVYAERWSELARAGSLIGIHDLQIASTALSHDLSVFTLNVADFQRVRGLTVIRPSW